MIGARRALAARIRKCTDPQNIRKLELDLLLLLLSFLCGGSYEIICEGWREEEQNKKRDVVTTMFKCESLCDKKKKKNTHRFFYFYAIYLQICAWMSIKHVLFFSFLNLVFNNDDCERFNNIARETTWFWTWDLFEFLHVSVKRRKNHTLWMDCNDLESTRRRWLVKYSQSVNSIDQ